MKAKTIIILLLGMNGWNLDFTHKCTEFSKKITESTEIHLLCRKIIEASTWIIIHQLPSFTFLHTTDKTNIFHSFFSYSNQMQMIQQTTTTNKKKNLERNNITMIMLLYFNFDYLINYSNRKLKPTELLPLFRVFFFCTRSFLLCVQYCYETLQQFNFFKFSDHTTVARES